RMICIDSRKQIVTLLKQYSTGQVRSTTTDTLRREPWAPATARVAAVISSPDSGVFAVTAAGPEPRRGHVIRSGVVAVAAVTAAGVRCLNLTLACRRVPLHGARP